MLSDDYEQEQEELREKLLQLNEEIIQQEEQAENIDRFISKVRKYLDLDELTPIVGILPASLLYDLQNGETA